MDKIYGFLNHSEVDTMRRPAAPGAQEGDALELTPPESNPLELTPPKSHQPVVEIPAEFPNFFHANDPVKAARIQGKVTEAVASVLRRSDLPYVVDPRTGQISRNGFFEELEKKIQALDPDAKVYISVQSILSYIYKKIYNEHQRQSTEDTTENVLNRIIQGASRKPIPGALFEIFPIDQDLPKLSALGIGSDLDISVDFSSGCTPNKREEIKQITKQFIESATDQLMPQADKTSVLTRSVLPVGDVVERKAQLERSMGQGGSPLDWLAFPVSSASGTQFVEGVPGTLGRFLKGEIEYVSPEHADNRDEQCIRMLRPLLELPFLKPSTKGAQILIQELELILAKLNKKIPLEGDRPLKRFEEMIRNARFEAAHNRFSVPREGDPIAHLVHQISMFGARNEKNLPLIPEFTRNQKIDTRRVSDHTIDKFLVSPAEFQWKYTDKGLLYHGTPKLEYVLTMIRNGLIASIPKKQGAAHFGAGTYTAQMRSIPAKYARPEGTVLELRVIRSNNLRVLDLPNFRKAHVDLYRKLEAEASTERIDLNQYLAKKFDLDIIINRDILIMNAAAVRLPKKIHELVRAKLESGFSVKERLVAQDLPSTLQELRSFERLGAILGMEDLPSVPSDSEIYQQTVACLTDPDVGVRQAVIVALGEIKPTDPTILKQIVGYLTNPNADVRQSVIGVLGAIKPTDPTIHQQIATCLTDSNADVRQAAINALGAIKPTDPTIHQQIATCLTDSNADVRQVAINALGVMEPTDPTIHQQIAACLTDSSAMVCWYAINALGAIKPTDPMIHQQIAAFLTDSDVGVRRAVIVALGAIKPTDPTIHQQIATCLTDSNADVRQVAINALGAIKPTDPTTLKQIAGYLTNSDADVRLVAIEALGAMESTDPTIHQQIALCLTDSNVGVRQGAIKALGAIKPTDPTIHQQIALCLTDSNADVRRAVIVALGAIKPTDPTILKQIVAYLTNPNADVCWVATDALGAIKPTDPTILKQIAGYLTNSNADVRLVAINALGAIKPTDPTILKQIAGYLADQNSFVRRVVIKALGAIKLTNSDPFVRSAAIRALGAIKCTDPMILKQIAGCLTDSNADVRLNAISALGAIKPTDPTIRKQIATCLTDSDVDVREAASMVLAVLQTP